MAGRPLKYETPEQLEQGIEDYFNSIVGEMHKGKWVRFPEPATVTGLALFLGFSDRQSLYDYEKREEFSCIIKRGRSRVECEYEKRLSGQNAAGSIFALKNMGWKDKTEVEQSGSLTINWNEQKTYETK